MRQECLRDPHRPEGIDAEGLLPGVVVDVADGILTPVLEEHAGVVDQQVQGLALQRLRQVGDLIRRRHIEPVDAHPRVLSRQ